MPSFRPPAHSERDPDNERRVAIYLPDGLATKLLCVCDAAAELESSEPNSTIHSDLEDLWSNVRASSVSAVDLFRAEEDVQRFVERYGLVHCLSCSDLSWLGVGMVKTPSEGLYEDILEAAFGNSSGRAAFENVDRNISSEIEDLFLNVSPPAFKVFASCILLVVNFGLTDCLQFNEAGEPIEPFPEIPQSSPPLRETSRVYHDRPHTPQVIYVNLSQQKYHDFWEIPDLMKKPSLFPPTLRNIKNWIFWRRIYGRRS